MNSKMINELGYENLFDLENSFIMACVNNQWEAVNKLLLAGADKNMYNGIAFKAASACGSAEVLKVLSGEEA